MSSRQLAQLKIRLPDDLKAFVARQAERNGSTLNSEVIRALRERMDRETKAAPAGAGTPAEA